MSEMIKSPVELVVGAVRSLNTPVRDISVLVDAMGLMGQGLLFPPSVKGWDGGRAWINTATLFTRQNILCFLLTGKMPVGYDALKGEEPYDPSELLADLRDSGGRGGGSAPEPEAVADYLLRFALGTNTGRNRASLTEFLAKHGNRAPAAWSAAEALLDWLELG